MRTIAGHEHAVDMCQLLTTFEGGLQSRNDADDDALNWLETAETTQSTVLMK